MTEIQHLGKICLNAQELSRQFPNDNILKLTFDKLTHRKLNLDKELENSLIFFDKYSLKDA